jgi:hypothetical protein
MPAYARSGVALLIEAIALPVFEASGSRDLRAPSIPGRGLSCLVRIGHSEPQKSGPSFPTVSIDQRQAWGFFAWVSGHVRRGLSASLDQFPPSQGWAFVYFAFMHITPSRD